MGFSIVIWDDVGEVLACLSASRPFYSLPAATAAECRAFLRAMEFFLELGFSHIQFEGDALLIIQAIKKRSECLAWYGDLVKEAKFNFQRHPEWGLSFTQREGNHAAHALAKHGLSLS